MIPSLATPRRRLAVEPQPSTLARGQGVALWRQIATAIEHDIAAGRGASPGDRLPTEAALSARFGVNRHTVRRAMEELEARGLIRVEQGRGSFVAEDVLDYPLGPRTRFSETIRRQNREPAGRMLRIVETEAEAQVARALGLRRGRPRSRAAACRTTAATSRASPRACRRRRRRRCCSSRVPGPCW